MVLGLLSKQPMHGYEMIEYLKISHADRWSDILPGSIYYAIKTLGNEGFIQIKGTESSGNRNKAIYEITDEGREEFLNLIKASWTENFVSFPKKLYTLLAFLEHVPKEELHTLIELQITKYMKELVHWDPNNIQYESKKMDLFSEAVLLNGKKHIELDIELLRTIQDLLKKN